MGILCEQNKSKQKKKEKKWAVQKADIEINTKTRKVIAMREILGDPMLA